MCAKWDMYILMSYILYIRHIHIYIYTAYIRTLRARADADVRIYAILPWRDSLCMSLCAVFISYSLIYPFAVSCVTVPGDLDLIFSRLSCAVRFDLHEWTRILATKCAVVAHLVAQSVVCVNKIAGRGQKKIRYVRRFLYYVTWYHETDMKVNAIIQERRIRGF